MVCYGTRSEARSTDRWEIESRQNSEAKARVFEKVQFVSSSSDFLFYISNCHPIAGTLIFPLCQVTLCSLPR